MKKTDATPVKDEAAPLAIGGEASKPQRRLNKKLFVKITVIVVALLLVVTVAVAVWWVFFRQDPNYLNISQLDSRNTRIEKAQELAKRELPKDPKDQASHYGVIAAYLYSAKQYTYAERYYLSAQKVTDEHKLDPKEYNFYAGLADVYEAMGNKSKAEEYQRREEDFMKANYSKEQLDQVEQAEKANGDGRTR